MLFMVVAKHTAEDCPGGLVRPDKDFFTKVVEHVERSGVTSLRCIAMHRDTCSSWLLMQTTTKL